MEEYLDFIILYYILIFLFCFFAEFFLLNVDVDDVVIVFKIMLLYVDVVVNLVVFTFSCCC